MLTLRNTLGMAAGMALLVGGLGCAPAVPAGKVRAVGVVRRGDTPLAIAPPATGTINFAGQGGGDSGTAAIGPDGGFSVVLSPGTYAVAVIAKDGVDTMDASGTAIPAKNLVAEKYGSTATSGLEVTIGADGPLTIVVD